MLEATKTIEENSDSYEVDLPDFQGPLDLLLNLIEAEELDITKISLARVTDQYLARLDILRETDPDDLTDFLVIAAKLILIKSEMLLPRPPPILIEDEEDVGDELARQLLVYKYFKEIAHHLRELESTGRRNFVRIAPAIKIERRLTPGEGDLGALLEAARDALAVKPPDPDVDEVVSPEIVTLGQQMLHIWQQITIQENISFQRLLIHTRSRLEVIVTLLAILELIKRNIINVNQLHHFGDIMIHKKKNVQEFTEIELEELVGLTDVS